MFLLVASGNKGKIREIKSILSDLNIEILSLKDVGINADIEENGSTFEENALIKACEIAKLVDMPVLADDSGLCVDALNGAPGIYSARYAGENATDADRIGKLLAELKNVNDRNARFVCVMAMVLPDGQRIVSEGTVQGTIAKEPMGASGFGYDPVFIPNGYRQSFAQLGEDEKNKLSHRYNALINLKKKIIDTGILS